MLPPKCSTIFAAMARPNPLPLLGFMFSGSPDYLHSIFIVVLTQENLMIAATDVRSKATKINAVFFPGTYLFSFFPVRNGAARDYWLDIRLLFSIYRVNMHVA
jgi:hypothetical protein